MDRKIKKFAVQEKINEEVRFSADLCKGHFDRHGSRTMNAFSDKLDALNGTPNE